MLHILQTALVFVGKKGVTLSLMSGSEHFWGSLEGHLLSLCFSLQHAYHMCISHLTGFVYTSLGYLVCG